MSARANAVAPLLAGCLLLSGCITQLDSRIATETAKGQRYSLPQPVLKVEPQADGTMAVEVLYLPDPNNTYTVTASSILGSYTLDVKTKEGLLDTVTFSPNSSAVVEQLATSAGNVEKAKIDARSKADEAAAKSATADATAISEATAAVGVANAKLKKLTELKDTGQKVTDEQIVAAEVELAVAEAKLANVGSSASSLNMAAANAPGAGQYGEAAGPIFFAMVPGKDGVINLVASSPQVIGETAFATPPAAPKPKTVAYEIDGSSVLRLGRPLVLRLKASPKPKSLIQDDVELEDASGATLPDDLQPTVNLTTVDGQDFVIVTLADATPIGRYALIVPVVAADGVKQQPATVKLEVRPKLAQ